MNSKIACFMAGGEEEWRDRVGGGGERTMKVLGNVKAQWLKLDNDGDEHRSLGGTTPHMTTFVCGLRAGTYPSDKEIRDTR